nr:hypothetical protein Iba_chr01fCG0490 [Ipomoea batatas]
MLTFLVNKNLLQQIYTCVSMDSKRNDLYRKVPCNKHSLMSSTG